MGAHCLYPAFLSYSHADRKVADWLHRRLEGYRVPPKLVGQKTVYGEVPGRLAPIFRDREELSASDSLGSAIEDALQRSAALIVVCSPSSAASHWVNEEVRSFKRLHRNGRVLAIVADGEPWASRVPGREKEECFPPALRFEVAPDGSLTEEPAEPIAADLRPHGDGRRLGTLKLIAGLIGVGLDELVQREGQRHNRWLRQVAAASLAGMALTTGLSVAAITARNEAREQRNEAQSQRAAADGLIEYMLTDLRQRLEPVGRLDVLDSVGQRALNYYGEQKLSDLDPDALGRRAKALHLVAEVGDLRGNSEAARRGFFEAARSTSELLARDPGNWQRVYDHAQSEFWLAYDAHNRGDAAAALRHFITYRDLGRRLVELDSKRPESRLELASAEVNVGVALVGASRPSDAIPAFERAAAALSTIQPRSREAALALGQAHGHKATALYLVGDNRRSIATRQEQLEVLSAPPLAASDREVQEGRAVIYSQTGTANLALGRVAAADAALTKSLAQWDQLVALDPANKFWRGERNAVRMWRIVARSGGDRAAARDHLGELIGDQQRLVGVSGDWVHKLNLLKMLAFERSLGGAPRPVVKPLVDAAIERRETLKADDLALVAALMIDEGDRLADRDRTAALAHWQRVAALLPAGEGATLIGLQQKRLQRRLGTDLGEIQKPPTAFAGIFSGEAGS